MLPLRAFDADGVLPPGDYELTLDELRPSSLVTGTGVASPTWDHQWRSLLVENLGVLVGQLRQVGVSEIFADGSFVEDKRAFATDSGTRSNSPRHSGCRVEMGSPEAS